MARNPAPISKKAAALWSVGDEASASRLAKLQPRQLRNRLGPPGRGVSAGAAPQAIEAALVEPAQKLVRASPRPAAEPSPAPPPDASPPSDPTAADIEAIDTLAEARSVLREIRAKMPTADPVRFASLAEKALSALNRIEQIEARRPRVPARDEVTARLVEVRDAAIARMGILTNETAAKLVEDRAALAAWAGQELAPRVASELQARVDAMFGGPPS